MENTVYEYGIMSSCYQLTANSKLTAYATMCMHFQNSPHMIVIYKPEESKEDSWMRIDGQVLDRLDEIFGGEGAFEKYVDAHADEIGECYKSIKKTV